MKPARVIETFAAALGALALFPPGPADAAEPTPPGDCPAPALTQCQEPTYLEGSCGQQHKARCRDLLTAAFEAHHRQSGSERQALMPKALGGEIGVSRAMSLSPPAEPFVHGAGGSYLGVVLEANVAAKSAAVGPRPPIEALAKSKAQWRDNGAQVSSCAEYVNERYHTYSAYADASAGRSGRALVAVAAQHAAGLSPSIRSRDGLVTWTLDWGKPAVRNEFFEAAPGPLPYPAGQQRYSLDPKLLAALARGSEQRTQRSLDWHLKMNAVLAKVPEDVLEDNADRRRAFSGLLAARRARWESYLNAASGKQGASEEMAAKAAADLATIDARIEEALMAAQAAGCLQIDGPTACDWAPSDLQRTLDSQVFERQEQDFQDCVAATGDDFSPVGKAGQREASKTAVPGAPPPAPTGDGASGTMAVGADVVSALIMDASTLRLWSTPPAPPEEPSPLDEGTRRARAGETHTNGAHYGDSRFNVGYEYGAHWGVRDVAGGRELCRANLGTGGHFLAYGTVFGHRFDVIHARALAETRGESVHAEARAVLLGIELVNVRHDVPLRFNLVQSPQHTGTLGGRFWFWLGPIPISVAAGISGTVGLTAALESRIDRDCTYGYLDVGVQGRVEPFARLRAYAEAAVDIFIAAVGIRGELTLLEAGLPLTASLSLHLDDPDFRRASLRVSTGLSARLSTLSGALMVFGRLGFCPLCWTGEGQIASWPGLRWSVNVLRHEFEMPLRWLLARG